MKLDITLNAATLIILQANISLDLYTQIFISLYT